MSNIFFSQDKEVTWETETEQSKELTESLVWKTYNLRHQWTVFTDCVPGHAQTDAIRDTRRFTSRPRVHKRIHITQVPLNMVELAESHSSDKPSVA